MWDERLSWKIPCMDCGIKGEYFMVKHEVWRQEAWLDAHEGSMCLSCLESRLGRTITPNDMLDAHLNTLKVQLEMGLLPSAALRRLI